MQLDLIDLGAGRDDGFRYVLVYIDLLTRHVWLRALSTKDPLSVAREVRTASCFLVCRLHPNPCADCLLYVCILEGACWPAAHLNHSHQALPAPAQFECVPPLVHPCR